MRNCQFSYLIKPSYSERPTHVLAPNTPEISACVETSPPFTSHGLNHLLCFCSDGQICSISILVSEPPSFIPFLPLSPSSCLSPFDSVSYLFLKLPSAS